MTVWPKRHGCMSIVPKFSKSCNIEKYPLGIKVYLHPNYWLIGHHVLTLLLLFVEILQVNFDNELVHHCLQFFSVHFCSNCCARSLEAVMNNALVNCTFDSICVWDIVGPCWQSQIANKFYYQNSKPINYFINTYTKISK